MKTFIRIFITLGFGTFIFSANAQAPKTINIEDCQNLARQNYPLIKQKELITKSNGYNLNNVSKGNLPQISINGQATYQSAVTEIPIKLPNADIPTISKDQYRIYAEINQTLFDGGVMKLQKQNLETNAVIEEQKLEVELYKLRERVSQLYFGILLVDEQMKLLDLIQKDLQALIVKTETAIANGTAYKGNLDLLKFELLKSNQRRTELKYNRKAFLEMLGFFMNQTLDEKTVLSRPAISSYSKNINRPELLLFDFQNQGLNLQEKAIKVKRLPKFNFFVQGGFGRPALNMLSNDFSPYAIGGLKMNWALNGFYTNKNEKRLIDIGHQNIDIQKETFIFNTNFSLTQQNSEINKLEELLASDDEIVALRVDIKSVTAIQLENGIINTNDYLREVNAEETARENKILHEIQLLMAKYNQQLISGN